MGSELRYGCNWIIPSRLSREPGFLEMKQQEMLRSLGNILGEAAFPEGDNEEGPILAVQANRSTRPSLAYMPGEFDTEHRLVVEIREVPIINFQMARMPRYEVMSEMELSRTAVKELSARWVRRARAAASSIRGFVEMVEAEVPEI